MKRLLSRLLTFGIIFALIGGIVFAIGFAMSGFNYEKLSSLSVVDNTYTESADSPIDSIEFFFNTSDINLIFDENATEISIVYQTLERKNKTSFTTITQSIESGKLIFKEAYAGKINIFPIQPSTKTTVTIPAAREISFFADVDTSDLTIAGNATFKSFRFNSDTGDINAKGATIKSLTSFSIETDTGDTRLGKIDATSLSIETDTGDVSIREGIILDKTIIDTDTGDVTIVGSLTSERTEIETDTGYITFKGEVKTTSLTIKSSTGDIETENAKIDAVNIEIDASTTDVEITLAGHKNDYTVIIKQTTGDSNISAQTGGTRTLNITLSTGDIEVDFKE